MKKNHFRTGIEKGEKERGNKIPSKKGKKKRVGLLDGKKRQQHA